VLSRGEGSRVLSSWFLVEDGAGWSWAGWAGFTGWGEEEYRAKGAKARRGGISGERRSLDRINRIYRIGFQGKAKGKRISDRMGGIYRMGKKRGLKESRYEEDAIPPWRDVLP